MSLSGPEEIAHAVRHLHAGGLVAFPTETVYGLGADATDERAVARVFLTKGRPASNPLIVHVSTPEMARSLVDRWTPGAEKLARAFWPGPLSIVLPKASIVPANVTGGGENVAVRCPDHPLTLAMIEAYARPLVGPSANRSGLVSPTTAEHVRSSFAPDDVHVLDGGPCRGGIESTVVSLVDLPRVLRPGLVSAEDLSRVLGRVVEPARVGQVESAPQSPGKLARHYAPRAPAMLFRAADWGDVLDALTDDIDGIAAVLTPESRLVPRPHVRLTMPVDPVRYAATLYSMMREADDFSPALILIERPDATDHSVWDAILDRLVRATTPWTRP